MTLTEFLLARIAEDEGRGRRLSRDLSPKFSGFGARLLAECEAKRRIVEMAIPSGWDEETGRPLGSSYVDGWWDALTFLALPYADHPDYREEWRP